MTPTKAKLNIQTDNKMKVHINHLFDHYHGRAYYTVVELESSEELTSDEYSTLELAEEAAFAFIKKNSDRYEPSIKSFSPITSAFYEYCVSEIIDAGYAPCAFNYDVENENLEVLEEIEWDETKCWEMAMNLGLESAIEAVLHGEYSDN